MTDEQTKELLSVLTRIAEALEAKSKPAAKPRAPKPDLSDDEIEQGVLRRLHVAGALGS